MKKHTCVYTDISRYEHIVKHFMVRLKVITRYTLQKYTYNKVYITVPCVLFY